MNSNTKKLFLLDAMALIYRAHFAFMNNQRFTSTGFNTSAILGFTNTLLEVLKKEKPTHIAVVFDTAAPTVRHEEFTDYKANREKMPEDLSAAIPVIIQLIEAFNIPVLSADGYEADDLIGTLAKKAEQQGFVTFMMTPDKDFGQLVSDKIFIYKPAKMGNPATVMGIKEVCDRYDIQRPEQVIDILGLMGDQVDNISGVPGVGEKTAIQLLKEFDSIENLLKNTHQLKGKLKERIEENADKAIFSKKLATIICDAPVLFEEEKLKLIEPNKAVLKDLFIKLEFRRLAEQVLNSSLFTEQAVNESKHSVNSTTKTDLFSLPITNNDAFVEEETPPQEPQNYLTIAQVEHTYTLIDTAEKRLQLIQELNASQSFCFDTETTGLNVIIAELVGIAFAIQPQKAYYLPIPEKRDDAMELLQVFKPIFENTAIQKIGQNLKFDISILQRYDIAVRGKLFDTMLAHYLIQPEMRHNMNILAETYLNYSPITIETLIGKKGKDQLTMRSISLPQLTEYAGEDADITIQLKNKFEPLLQNSALEELFNKVELPLIPVLVAMETEGINLDRQTLAEISVALTKEILLIEQEIQTLAGTKFNIASPKQVGEVLFELLKIIEKPKKTKTGQYATGEEVLVKLTTKHPIVEKILDYRELQKLKNTYVDTLPELINPETQRIHTSYNQIATATGRLSSDNPNLQNIPIKTARGREIRKAFIPKNENYVLLSADYSQIELRLIAALSGDISMVEAFNTGKDIHTATAAKVYKVPLEEVTSEMRRNAKMVNFGIIYGISAFGLSERLNIPRKEAATIIEEYFNSYPLIKTYMDNAIVLAKQKGYVETLLGRRRYLRDINSGNAVIRAFAERNAINAPIQGSAADMIKVAMIAIQEDFVTHNLKSKMLLQVHDELVFDVLKEEVDIVKTIVEERMKNALPLQVPIEVSIGIGNNWLEAH